MMQHCNANAYSVCEELPRRTVIFNIYFSNIMSANFEEEDVLKFARLYREKSKEVDQKYDFQLWEDIASALGDRFSVEQLKLKARKLRYQGRKKEAFNKVKSSTKEDLNFCLQQSTL